MTADQPPFRMNQSAYIEPNSPERARKTSGVQNKQADIAVGLMILLAITLSRQKTPSKCLVMCGTSKGLSVVDGA
jgi:hypothetical protein